MEATLFIFSSHLYPSYSLASLGMQNQTTEVVSKMHNFFINPRGILLYTSSEEIPTFRSHYYGASPQRSSPCQDHQHITTLHYTTLSRSPLRTLKPDANRPSDVLLPTNIPQGLWLWALKQPAFRPTRKPSNRAVTVLNTLLKQTVN